MTRDADMGADGSAARRNGRHIGDVDDVRAAIAWEMARHEKLFDDIWDQVMAASPEEIAVMLGEADPASPDGRLVQQSGVVARIGQAGPLTASAVAFAKAMTESARQLLSHIANSEQGSGRHPLLVGAVSIALVAIAVQLLDVDEPPGDGGATTIVETSATWRRYDGAAYHESSYVMHNANSNLPRLSAAGPAAIAAGSPRQAESVSSQAALLVAPITEEALPAEIGPATATNTNTPSAAPQSPAAQADLTLVALSVACSEGKDEFDCTLTKPSAAATRVVLSDGLTSGIRDWYSASTVLGSGVVCVIGPRAESQVDCREVPRSAEWRSGFGGFSFATVTMGLASGAIRLSLRQGGEKPLNP